MAMDMRFNPQQRASVKEASRRADAQALSSGQKSHAQLISENSIFRGLARSARVSHRSARRLV
jgi:hypothetical protein